MKARKEASWWERVIVGVLLVIAVIYGRCARGGTSSPQVLQALARINMARGDFDKAEMLIRDGLSSFDSKNETDPASPRYAEASEQKSSYLVDLAWIYKSQGRLEKAEQFARQALKLQQKVYYESHPYIAYTLRIMGSIYQAQAKFSQADESLDKALTIISKCHLPDDPVVASFEVDIARLRAAEGNLDQAETLYERAYLSISDYYGPEHLYTAGVLANIGKLYFLQNRLDEAEQTLTCALSIQERFYDGRHPEIAAAKLTLARIYLAKGEFAQAERLFIKTVAEIESRPRLENPLRGEILACLADLYLETDRVALVKNTFTSVEG